MNIRSLLSGSEIGSELVTRVFRLPVQINSCFNRGESISHESGLAVEPCEPHCQVSQVWARDRHLSGAKPSGSHPVLCGGQIPWVMCRIRAGSGTALVAGGQ